MALAAGTYRFGPDNATLSVRTGRSGAAAKAGHDLVLQPARWTAALEVGADPAHTSIELSADAASLRVHKATGGMQKLGDEDKAGIVQTIDDDVLKRQDITFRSTRCESGAEGGRLSVEGELTLVGTTRPIAFDVAFAVDGTVSATAVVTQTLWGMKPYSALFGALKVADDVEVVLHGRL